MPEMTVDELIASLGKPKYTPPVNPEDWGGGGVRGFDSKAIQAAPAPDRESSFVPNAQEAIRGTQGADRLPPPPPDYQIPATGQPGASDAIPGAPPTPFFAGHVPGLLSGAPREYRVADETMKQALQSPTPGGPNVGTSTVPPVPTDIPISTGAGVPSETPQPVISTTGPSQFTPVEQAAQPDLDNLGKPGPNAVPGDVLMHQYLNPMKDVMRSRAEDLDRMDQAKWQAMMMAGSMGVAGNLAGQAQQGAEFTRLAGGEPTRLNTMAKAGLAAQEMQKATAAGQEFDPNSPTAEGKRIAMIGSPETEEYANRVAAETGSTPEKVKADLYKQSKGWSPMAIDKYMEARRNSGAFSEQRAKEAETWAKRDVERAQEAQLKIETKSKEAIYKALMDKNSATTKLGKMAVIKMYGRDAIYAAIPNFDDATGMEIATFDPGLGASMMGVIKFRTEKERENAAKRFINDKTEFKEAAPSGEGAFGQISNPVAINAGEEVQSSQDQQAATEAIGNGMEALATLDSHNIKGAAHAALDTATAGRLKFNLARLAHYSQRLAPDSRAQLEAAESALSEKGVTVKNTWLGATAALVEKATNEINANVRAKNSKVKYKDEYINPAMKAPPSTPPVLLESEPLKPKDVTVGGKKYTQRGYRFKNVGPYDYVDYVYNPISKTWSPPKGHKAGEGVEQ